MVYTGKDGDEGYTVDNRGTEFIKSPEMLTVAYSSNIERASYDRRRKVPRHTLPQTQILLSPSISLFFLTLFIY